MKKFLALMLALVMVFALCACGQQAAEPAAPAAAEPAAEPVVLKLGTILSDDHPFAIGYKAIAAEVAEKTNGAVQIEIYSNSTLGGEPDLVSGMNLGTVDMASIGPSELANYIQDFKVFEVPYMFKGEEHFEKFMALDSPVGAELYKTLENDMNIRVVMPIYNGARQITCNKALDKVEDLAGLKMRCPNAQGSIDMVEVVFGATPTPMNLSEVYLALQNGTADGQENPVTNIYTNSFYEVQDYLNLTGHVQSAGLLCMSKAAVDKLTEEQYQIIVDAIANEAPAMKERVASAEQAYIDEMENAGMNIHTPADMSGFYANAEKLIAKYIEEGTFSQELYDNIQALNS